MQLLCRKITPLPILGQFQKLLALYAIRKYKYQYLTCTAAYLRLMYWSGHFQEVCCFLRWLEVASESSSATIVFPPHCSAAFAGGGGHREVTSSFIFMIIRMVAMRMVRMAIMFKPMVMFMLVTERGKMMMMRASVFVNTGNMPKIDFLVFDRDKVSVPWSVVLKKRWTICTGWVGVAWSIYQDKHYESNVLQCILIP